MKTDISRWSHVPQKNYSGVYQQQGRMISDADWNELVEIVKMEIRDSLNDVVGSGAAQPVIQLNEQVWQITPNATVYVDGIRGVINPYNLRIKFTEQPNFPCVIEPGKDSIFYVDLWERTVTGTEDSNLNDPGLNGADTCTRTQTLAQIKSCDKNQALNWAALPQVGDAILNLSLHSDANRTSTALSCGNQLFRFEVHDVVYENLKPTQITLKWSAENASHHYRVDVQAPPLEFRTGGWIYEFYSDNSEKHLGLHLPNDFTLYRLKLRETYTKPSPDELQKLGAKAGQELQTPLFVRRWDGYCTLQRSGDNNWLISEIRSPNEGIDLSSRGSVTEGALHITLHLDLESFQLSLTLQDILRDFDLHPNGGSFPDVGPIHGGMSIGHGPISGVGHTPGGGVIPGGNKIIRINKQFLAGDYWLAVVRQNAHHDEHEDQRVQVLNDGLPLGILHHYLPLPQPESDDAIRRKFSFPPLTNLTADRVGYDSKPQEARWKDVLEKNDLDNSQEPGNLQEAVDQLISKWDAGDMPYSAPNCIGASNTVKSRLLPTTLSSLKISDVLDAILCRMDSSTIPFETSGALTIKNAVDLKVNRSGDSMTGLLEIPCLRITGSNTQSFTLAYGATNGHVLTSDSAGNGRWQPPMVLGWGLSANGTSLSTYPSILTTSVRDLALAGLITSPKWSINKYRIHANYSPQECQINYHGGTLLIFASGQAAATKAGAFVAIKVKIGDSKIISVSNDNAYYDGILAISAPAVMYAVFDDNQTSIKCSVEEIGENTLFEGNSCWVYLTVLELPIRN